MTHASYSSQLGNGTSFQLQAKLIYISTKVHQTVNKKRERTRPLINLLPANDVRSMILEFKTKIF